MKLTKKRIPKFLSLLPISGAERALKHQNIDILGFPFSISETFQYRNTNKNQEEAFE
jgi:hypothetical protein